VPPKLKLDKDVIQKMVNYCRAGAYVETAAAACGIDKETFYNWLRKGAKQKSGIYRVLNDALDKAQAEWELRDLAAIDKATTGRATAIVMKDVEGRPIRDGEGNLMYMRPIEPDWKAAALRLSRKASKRWCDKQVLEHTGKDGGPIETRDMTAEKADAEAKRILERIHERQKRRSHR